VRAATRCTILPLGLAVASLAAATALGEESSQRRYELPNADVLELTLPAGWADHVEQPDGGGPPTIEISITPRGPSQVFVTPEWADPTAKEIRELAALREMIRDAAERIRPQAAEGAPEVRQLNGANGIGYYFSVTDRDPGPGEFKYMSQGALQVGTLTLWFTVLTNDGEDTVAVEAFSMLQAAVHRRTGLDQL
jgi:hypothetical protein